MHAFTNVRCIQNIVSVSQDYICIAGNAAAIFQIGFQIKIEDTSQTMLKQAQLRSYILFSFLN